MSIIWSGGQSKDKPLMFIILYIQAKHGVISHQRGMN